MSKPTQKQKDKIAKAWRPLYQQINDGEIIPVPAHTKAPTRSEVIDMCEKIDADIKRMMKNARIVRG